MCMIGVKQPHTNGIDDIQIYKVFTIPGGGSKNISLIGILIWIHMITKYEQLG